MATNKGMWFFFVLVELWGSLGHGGAGRGDGKAVGMLRRSEPHHHPNLPSCGARGAAMGNDLPAPAPAHRPLSRPGAAPCGDAVPGVLAARVAGAGVGLGAAGCTAAR